MFLGVCSLLTGSIDVMGKNMLNFMILFYVIQNDCLLSQSLLNE